MYFYSVYYLSKYTSIKFLITKILIIYLRRRHTRLIWRLRLTNEKIM